jgi:hypothetical protein
MERRRRSGVVLSVAASATKGLARQIQPRRNFFDRLLVQMLQTYPGYRSHDQRACRRSREGAQPTNEEIKGSTFGADPPQNKSFLYVQTRVSNDRLVARRRRICAMSPEAPHFKRTRRT